MEAACKVDHRDLIVKFVTTVVAVTCAFLAVACDTMAHDLMCHTAVTHETNGHIFMLDHRFMLSCQKTFDKFLCRILRDLSFTFVADTADTFDLFYNLFVIVHIYDFYTRFDYLHLLFPLYFL